MRPTEVPDADIEMLATAVILGALGTDNYYRIAEVVDIYCDQNMIYGEYGIDRHHIYWRTRLKVRDLQIRTSEND